MKEEYLMNDKTFNRMIENCREEIAEGDYTDKGKEKLNNEIAFILDGKTSNEKWARLTKTNIFKFTYGEWANISGNMLYVER